MTYQQQGVAKPGVNPAHHAIVYTGTEPQPTREERAQGTMRTAIKVSRDEPTTALDPLSRLNYARIYTVEHNTKVKAFGWIHPNSRALFEIDRKAVHRSIDSLPQSNVPADNDEAIEEGTEETDSEGRENGSDSDGEESDAGSHDGSN